MKEALPPTPVEFSADAAHDVVQLLTSIDAAAWALVGLAALALGAVIIWATLRHRAELERATVRSAA